MVFTVGNSTAFFTSADQMGLKAELWIALQSEGIKMIEDLGEFKDTRWIQVSTNLQNPTSITDPTNQGQNMRPHNFTLGAKSLNRLKVSAAMVPYYESMTVH